MPAAPWQAYALLIGMNIPVYIVVGRLFFRDLESFFEALFFWIKPDILSAFSGEYWDDLAAEFRLFIWAACCVAITYSEMRVFPGLWAWVLSVV